jgi:hypothetical protein
MALVIARAFRPVAIQTASWIATSRSPSNDECYALCAFILKTSVNCVENSEYIEKNNRLSNINLSPNG